MGIVQNLGISRRSFLKSCALAGVVLGLNSCKLQQPEPQKAFPQSPLRYSLIRPTTVHPHFVSTQADVQVVSQVYLSLLSYDFGKKSVVGSVCESWEFDEKKLEYIFKLNKKCFFSNGRQLTSDLFLECWTQLITGTKASRSDHRHLLNVVEGYFELESQSAKTLSGVTCPDDVTLRVVLREPCALFPLLLTHPALSVFYLDPDTKQMVGCGPYCVKDEWDLASDLTLYKNEYYDLSEVNPPEIQCKFVENLGASYKAIQAGELDLCTIPPAKYHDSALNYGVSRDGYTIEPGKQSLFGKITATSLFLTNLESSPLKDEKLRQALSLCIDRDELCATFFDNQPIPAHSIIPPLLDSFEYGEYSYSTYDPDLALKLFDSVRKNPSKALEITIIFDEMSTDAKALAFIKEVWEQTFNITVKLDELSESVMRQRLKDGAYDLAFVTICACYPSVDAIVYPLFGEKSTLSPFGLNDYDLKKSLDKARAQNTIGASQEIWKDVIKTTGEKAYVIPVYFDTLSIVGSKALRYGHFMPNGLCDCKHVEFN